MTTTADPVPQHLQALERANRVRFARSSLKAALAAHTPQAASLSAAADVVLDPPEFAATMRVGALLCACHRVGPYIAGKIMGRAGLGETVTLGRLTDRQRRELARVLRDRSTLGLWARLDHRAEVRL